MIRTPGGHQPYRSPSRPIRNGRFLSFSKAYGEDDELAILLLLGRGRIHTPAQVDGLEVVETLAKPLFEKRKHVNAQPVALRVHVAEGTGDEDRT